jgi:hypothetical protein
MLETGGWVELKPVRYKPHLIARIVIPLEAESRWCAAFGFMPPTEEEARRVREFSWEPELGFLSEAKLNLPFAELQQLNAFLKARAPEPELVPIKERSLQIFVDEKRLDALLASALFRPGRLELEKHLRCEMVGVPLGWKRGPASASAQPVIALENAATWHSYCRWNAERALFSAVVYGDGNRFIDGVAYLKELFTELGGCRRLCYFGDLDPHGLAIPQIASARAQALGLPSVEPHLWSYQQLLTCSSGRQQPGEGEPPAATLCDWLGTCAEPARQLFAAGHRLAQERIGWEFLKGRTGTD